MTEDFKYQIIKKLVEISGNKGHRPSHAIPKDTKHLIIDLYQTKYHEANFTNYS